MIYKDLGGIADARGLTERERAQMGELVELFRDVDGSNRRKRRYYMQHVTVGECNLGIALPSSLRNFEMPCCWPEKAVTALKDRSRFDGFVSASGASVAALDAIVRDNELLPQYGRACGDELVDGVVFSTLSAGGPSGVRVRFHSAESAAALWDGLRMDISCGFAIIDYDRDCHGHDRPSLVYLYTDDAVVELERDAEAKEWEVSRRTPHSMGRPLMVAMANDPDTCSRPLGRSRVSRAVQGLTQGYIRTMTNASLALEFDTTPQKYLLGITDEQYDALINQKFQAYVGSLMLGTRDGQTGETPTFGQLAQGTLQPHADMLRMLSTQFAAVSSLSVTDTGVVNDANPTSYEAIAAANEKLIIRAQDLNAGNGEAMRKVALMALAIAGNKSMDDLTDEERDVMPHFLNPAMPSLASTADAAVKIASADQSFAGTQVFYEMLGFDKPTIARIMSETARQRATAAFNALLEA